MTIPLVFLLAREIFSDDRLALACAAIVAVMPEFAFDVARVGNDCLSVALFTAFTWMAVRQSRLPAPAFPGPWTISLGLLSKAYFLTAVPVALAMVWRRKRWALLIWPLLAAGWWYVRNIVTTGTLSGLSESVILRGAGLGAMLHKALEISWPRAIDAILLTHLYYGGWSPLGARGWMYHVLYGLIFLAIAGLVRLRRDARILWVAAMYSAFWAGQLYNVVLLYASKGIATSMGWYLYAVVGAEVVLCVAGLLRFTRWAAALGVLLFALLDLYGMHAKAIPYYTGMIRHRADGGLPAVNLAAWDAGAFARLAIFKGSLVSGPLLFGLWTAYVVATLTLIVWIAVETWRAGPAPKPSRLRK